MRKKSTSKTREGKQKKIRIKKTISGKRRSSKEAGKKRRSREAGGVQAEKELQRGRQYPAILEVQLPSDNDSGSAEIVSHLHGWQPESILAAGGQGI